MACPLHTSNREREREREREGERKLRVGKVGLSEREGELGGVNVGSTSRNHQTSSGQEQGKLVLFGEVFD